MPAQATAALDKKNFVIGLLTTNCAAMGMGTVMVFGQLTLTAAQWIAVTRDEAVLTPGAWYYVDVTSGYLCTGLPTTWPPPGTAMYSAPVGIALTSTTMLILVSPPILWPASS
jgi:hypothetical protein